ncbi:putative lipoyltransferase 2, mitochondrial [Anopheles aquasalis]|uniref:putative lipoyltransferase 2, mitochondrial n=1 Tax=Anopheles aquasalis TaxID=42839 RepID=UPI00215B5A34|nr:putative lipoyltransferase 2, mitochondrial [Anopheles aquasalis]
MASRLVRVLRAGKLSYRQGLQLQTAVVNHVRDRNSHVLILTEHEPVYTIGIRTRDYSEEEEHRLLALGADFVRTNRGGLITFHGPGQLVAYPVLNLRHFQPSVRWYVCHLERTIIELCRRYGLKDAQTTPDTGVWIGDRKICAMGIHVSRYITSHGLALNCDNDLSWFRHIVPCGLAGKGVTSLAQQLAEGSIDQRTVEGPITIDGVTPHFLRCFSDTFECDLTNMEEPVQRQLLEESRLETKG